MSHHPGGDAAAEHEGHDRGERAHRAQAEAHVLNGNTGAAIEQLQLALKAGDGDYYQLSATEARLRQLRQQDADERKDSGRKPAKS